jgi:ElaB/YqjD/DUF883 family membrane-anchored ribosome-binding protein
MTTNYEEDPVFSPEDDAGDSGAAKQRAQEVAGSAAEQGQHVAGVAQEHAKKITGEARDQVQGLLDEASTQLDEQSRTQKTRLAETLRGLGEDLERMSSKSSEDSRDPDSTTDSAARQLVQQAARQAQDFAGRLESKEPRELLDDVRRFARQKPGPFILGALVAGVVAGRLTRGAKAAREEDDSTSTHAGPTPDAHITTTPPRPVPVADGLDATAVPVTDVANDSVSGGPK